MKKYLLGIMAIAMATGFSAFTTKSAKKTRTQSCLFSYAGFSFTQQAVADPLNWVLIDDHYIGMGETCGKANVESACEIVVSSADVEDEQITLYIPVVMGTRGCYAVEESCGIEHAFNDVPD